MTNSLVRTFSAKSLAVALALALPTFVAGCFSSIPKQDWAAAFDREKKTDSDAKKGTPKFDVVGQSLGEGQEVSIPTNDLAKRVSELTAAGRKIAAARWIQRHPEATLEWLRTGSAATKDPALSLAAEVHDRQCSAPGAAHTWASLDTARRANPEPYKAYLEARNRFKNSLTQGQVSHALNQELLKLAGACDSKMLEIDAWQLQGTAQLLNEKPSEAAEALSQAAELAMPLSPYQGAYLLLLLSDAQRRAEQYDQAAETWQQAVLTASQMLAAENPVHDPVLWEKLGYQRPVDRAWPEDAVRMLQHLETLPSVDPLSGGQAADAAADAREAETAVWNAIGVWYLERSHGQAALVSFKRAEASAADEETRTWLRIRQARSLIQLQQDGAATALLVKAATKKDSTTARAALGLLGSLRLKSGQVQQGLGLLRKSVEQADGVEWSERADAEVDLSLAYLMIGAEQEGIKRLHAAQERFEREGNWESLTLALANEAAYLEETKQNKEAAAVRRRLDELERS